MDGRYIASLDLLAVPASGERIPLAFRIGRPEADPDGDWRCVVRLDGLYDDLVPMRAGDSMQALCLALGLAATLLRSFTGSGGRLLFAEGGPEPADETDWPLESYFGWLGVFSADDEGA